MKTICMFCGKSHTKVPNLCRTKGEIMGAYCQQLPVWRVVYGIDNGFIDLDGEAMRLIRERRKSAGRNKPGISRKNSDNLFQKQIIKSFSGSF